MLAYLDCDAGGLLSRERRCLLGLPVTASPSIDYLV